MRGSPSSRRAWIEIPFDKCPLARSTWSPSSRRAWIEIHRAAAWGTGRWVALLAEGVDRNWHNDMAQIAQLMVALLAEGVDRNRHEDGRILRIDASPSSRRAWIEISGGRCPAYAGQVALLAEGVDRNCWMSSRSSKVMTSPSSRRAWIEIMHQKKMSANGSGRPPRGGRG